MSSIDIRNLRNIFFNITAKLRNLVIPISLENLFSPRKIGSVEIKNRIMRSATFEGMASHEGEVTDELIELYRKLAQGGTGLVITSASAVDSRYTVGSKCLCLNDDSFIAGHKRLVDTVHEFDVKIGAQLAHNGRQGSHPKYSPVAPSPVLYPPTNCIPKELTELEIGELIEKFAKAGRRAYESGYDMVQLHAAHGYLLSSFLSPYTNKRTDEFGGTTQKRTRILRDIYHQLRDEVGTNFPIIIKMQAVDGIPEGLTLQEAKKIGKILVDSGFDAIEPSGGLAELQMKTDNALPSRKVKVPEDENFLLFAVKELRPIMKRSALIQVGGIRNPLSAEQFLKTKTCDFVAMSRPFIQEPDLPNRWQKGDLTPAYCISCNSCLVAMYMGQPLYCAVKKKLERKSRKKESET